MVYEKRGDYRFYFAYDAMGNLAEIIRINPAGTVYTCFVLCNSRGDVLELRNTDGSLFAKYEYDAWGNTTHIYSAAGNEITSQYNVAVQNPIRYRGYYYDNESGLYYLQSRYYISLEKFEENCHKMPHFFHLSFRVKKRRFMRQHRAIALLFSLCL